MPAFERKNIPFNHQGMNWNAPPDKIPDGQVCWAKNVRVLQKGTVTSAHGVTSFADLTSLGFSYAHSISRLNNFNTAQPPTTYVDVVGVDTSICVGTQATLTNGTINPINTPGGFPVGLQLSGNPLTMVDAVPVGGTAAWKYIGDSTQNLKVGYFPGDSVNPGVGNNSGKARGRTVGILPPVNTVSVSLSAGQLTGSYQWMFVYRNTFTGERSNPSAATRNTQGTPATALSSQQATFTTPATPTDWLTGSADANIVVDIYRFGGVVLRWALVGSVPGNTSFTDNTPDANLLTAPAPSQNVDATTGLTRFNLYQPFVLPQNAQFGNHGTMTKNANGTWIMTTAIPDGTFNLGLLPGSVISINNFTFTVYQVRSSRVIELTEDATNYLTSGSTYSWSILAGSLAMGQPLSHIWGVYGLGQTASYIFACGSTQAPGTLFWTNGNDPDSTDLVNSLVITSPSEPLRGGCIYDGRPYVWSTERMFAIHPSTTIAGQFTVEEIPGAKGLWMEYSLTVQSNGFADQSVTWRGEDGIYDWSPAGLRRLTDDLYSFFPHDNMPGIAPETIMPFLNAARSSTPEYIGNLDDTQPKYHRLSWFQGVLFYDFVAQSAAGQTYSTLVYDSVNCGGWVSLDQPFANTTKPVARGVDVTQNNLKVSWGPTIYDYTGTTRGFKSRLVTRAEDMGDPRANKLCGDYFLDLTPLAADFTAIPLTNFHNSSLTQNTVTQSSSRTQSTLDFQGGVNGLGVLTRTLGLDLQWTAGNAQFSVVLNQWQPSFVPKPENIGLRALDKTDDGRIGDKYLRGFVIEANTFNAAINLKVLVDGTAVAGTYTLTANGQLEVAFAIASPAIGGEFQLQADPASPNVVWEAFAVRWIWEPYPELAALFSAFTDCGYRGVKFMQGGVIPLDTGGQDVSFTLKYDGGTIVVGPFNTPAGFKTPVPFSFVPFLAHELQWQPSAPVRVWYDEVRWIWEPSPELATEWKTPPMTHGLSGWLHQRLLWIAYLASASVTFKRYFTDGTSDSLTLPTTSGAYTKALFTPAPKKTLSFQYEANSSQGFKMFVNDCEFHTKAWGSEGSYTVQKPIGAPSVVEGAEI